MLNIRMTNPQTSQSRESWGAVGLRIFNLLQDGNPPQDNASVLRALQCRFESLSKPTNMTDMRDFLAVSKKVVDFPPFSGHMANLKGQYFRLWTHSKTLRPWHLPDFCVHAAETWREPHLQHLHDPSATWPYCLERSKPMNLRYDWENSHPLNDLLFRCRIRTKDFHIFGSKPIVPSILMFTRGTVQGFPRTWLPEVGKTTLLKLKKLGACPNLGLS